MQKKGLVGDQEGFPGIRDAFHIWINRTSETIALITWT